MKNKTLTQLFARYQMPSAEAIAKKMLQTVEKSTPQEIGRVILRSKRDRQSVINLQPKH